MVDDVELNHIAARAVLEDTYELYEARSAEEALKMLERVIPDLILLDVIMPGMDGYGLIKLLKKDPLYKNIPVIFLTAETRAEAEVEGFNCGIVDYITKPFVPLVMKKRIETQIALSEYEQSLKYMVEKKVADVERMYDLITVSFASLVESRDGVTGGHLKNTSIYFTVFAEYLMNLPQYKEQLPLDVVKKACRAAPLHDVGKIAIEDAVLRKASSLDEEEFGQMKMHSIIGGDIFKFIKEKSPDKAFAEIAEAIARYHHEKWNGKGYPEGLKGEEIPLVARIMSIVDVYDALTSERPYKEPYSHEKAMLMIVERSGQQFDPALVQEFVNIGSTIKDCLLTREQMLEKQQYFMVKNNWTEA